MSSLFQTSRQKLKVYGTLMRVDRPIGSYLLLWPTLWALWIASEGMPSLSLLLIFTAGVFLTRSAGCVINDYADRHLDGHVKRTAQRPLPMGLVTEKEALLLFAGLMLTAFVLVLFTNTLTIVMSFGGLLLASAYPFMKRYTHLPQVVLGAAFSWSIPMAFTAVQEEIPRYVWLIYLANLLWTVAYDTLYAMVDREDDLKIGIKSSAILFGDADRWIVGLLQGLMLLSMILLGLQLSMSLPYYLSLIAAAGLFGYHQFKIRSRHPDACFKAFLENHYAALIIFIGIGIHYYAS